MKRKVNRGRFGDGPAPMKRYGTDKLTAELPGLIPGAELTEIVTEKFLPKGKER